MGKFIAFEGIDGSGKSTQARIFHEKLLQDKKESFLTVEPTEHEIGRYIREILSGRKIGYDMRTIAALFTADRFHHLSTDIICRLESGINVVTDRYYYSSIAYQSTDEESMDWIINMNSLCRKPDYTVFIDLKPTDAMERINSRNAKKEIFETLEKQKDVYEKYLSAFKKLEKTDNVIFIDGRGKIDEIADMVYEKLSKFI